MHVSWSFVKAKELVSSAKPMVSLPARGSRALYKGVRKRIKRIGEREDPWRTPERTAKGAVFPLKERSI